MYYNLNVNAGDVIAGRMDAGVVVDLVRSRYGVATMEEVEVKIVEIIRSPKVMKALCEELKIGKLEFLMYCSRIAPEQFNYHLLRFIKENYNFEREPRIQL